jgi:tetratricopeptide (TPR) repeat protein
MLSTARVSVALVLVGLLAVAGCARSPEAKKARYLARGDAYFEREKHAEAIIEYANALRLDGTNPHVITRLGLAYYHTGQIGQAIPYLLKARELGPENLDVRLKLGTIYLLGMRRDDARKEATAVLSKDPRNLDGLLLSAATVSTPAEADTEIQRLEEARAIHPDRAKLLMTLGMLYLKQQSPERAERAFLAAVEREPKSLEAHLALGDFYASRRDTAQAEREYKAAVAAGPVASIARVRLADFYFAWQKPEEGKRVLKEVTEKARDFLPAWRRLAEVAVAERRYDDAVQALQPIFKKNGSDLEANLLMGRIHLARKQPAEAIQVLQGILKAEPRFAPARYNLALAQLEAGNINQAKSELKDITADFPDAALLLADLHLQSGAVEPAVEILEKLLAKQPNFQGYVLLGTAYMRKREPAKAAEAFRNIVTRAPKDPRGPYLVGLVLRAEGKRAEARKAFEEALTLLPDYVEPLAQLVALSFDEQRPDQALDRVQRQLLRAPKSAGVLFLLGGVQERRRDMAEAEKAFVKALEIEPAMISAYVALGQLYASQERWPQALAKLDEAVKRNPKNVAAHMLRGVIYERRGDIRNAEKAYETALEANPRFAPAANNLAYLYSEYGGDKERALQLAQRAKESAPQEPHVSDTLGWILYKRGVYPRALTLLKESATKLPDHAEVHYHLGMTYAKLGDKEGARSALSKAVNSPTGFAGKDEARKVLREF